MKNICKVCQQVCPDFTAQDEAGSPSSIWQEVEDVTVRQWDLKKQQLNVLHPSWESLTASLGQDCPICWMIWRRLRSWPLAKPVDEKVEGFQTWLSKVNYRSEEAEYFVEITLEGTKSRRNRIPFLVWRTTEEYFVEAEKQAPLSGQHTPESVANVAQGWMKACEKEHSMCKERSSIPSDSSMPTRLLDLGDGDSKTWRIFETKERVEYIALSHRWSKNTPRLLREGPVNYFESQPDDALPLDYQEVIAICRAMSIRYFWIDSLCIFQDVEEDFRDEAKIMMDIYQNAHLTFSICWDYGEATIFQKFKPRTIPRPPSLEHKLSTIRASKAPALPQGDYVFIQCRDEFRDNVTEALINRRAWVLQERCLSRRILYLGNEQLYWECDRLGRGMNHVASEVASGNVAAEGRRPYIFTDVYALRDTSWEDVIERYTNCGLTFEKDKLIAISGVARLFAKKTGDAYFAGIWPEYWARDLFWEPAAETFLESQETPDLKHSTTLAKPPPMGPSWSWAGFRGPVKMPPAIPSRPSLSSKKINTFELRDVRPLAMLTETIITPPGSDAFTSFDRAVLKFRCLLIPAKFDDITHKKMMEQISASDTPIGLRCHQNLPLDSTGLDVLQFEDSNGSKDGSQLILRFSRPYNPSLRLLFVPCFLENFKGNFHQGEVDGLVVQETGDSQEFVRIGTFSEGPIWHFGLSPMISNTLIKLGVGTDSAKGGRPATAEEAAFESKLRDYAATQVSTPVFECFKDKEISCSSFPYLQTAQWIDILLA
ncbi:hypothetical protein ACHAPT_010836 [Fusarium lateritium]